MAGAGEHGGNGFVFPGGEFEDEGAAEVAALKLGHEPRPIDVTFARREVVVAVAAVIVHMNQMKVAGELVDDHPEFPAEMGVAGVEAGADLAMADAAEEVKHVVGVAEEQVGEHVFQEKVDAQLAAAVRDCVERLGSVPHAGEEFLLGRAAGTLGTGMKDEVFTAHRDGGLAGGQQLADSRFTLGWIERGDVDLVGEGRV